MHHVSRTHSFRFFVRDIKIICFLWSRTPSDLTPKDTTNSGQHSNPPVFDFHGTEILEVVPASSTKMRTSCESHPVWKNITIMIKKSFLDLYWSSPIHLFISTLHNGSRFQKGMKTIDSFRTVRPGMMRPSWITWQRGWEARCCG